jgi:hypothetical protein
MPSTTSHPPGSSRKLRPQDLLTIQRAAGNQAVGRLLRSAAPEPESALAPAAPAAPRTQAASTTPAESLALAVPVTPDAPVTAAALRGGRAAAILGWLATAVRRVTRRDRGIP